MPPKRRRDPQDNAAKETKAPAAKKTKVVKGNVPASRGRGRPRRADESAGASTARTPALAPVLNSRPSKKLDIYVFGAGEFGELGLHRPSRQPCEICKKAMMATSQCEGSEMGHHKTYVGAESLRRWRGLEFRLEEG